jgi:hypothetical protein
VSAAAWLRHGSDARFKASRVIAIIRRRKGHEHAIAAEAIVAQLQDERLLVDERLVQKIVKWAVEKRGLPIGSLTWKPFGYFWIVSLEERREVRNALLRRVLSTLGHAQRYDDDAIVAPLAGQLRMFVEEP